VAAAADTGDCSVCTRRTFLKGVGATAAGTVAATGGLADVAAGQQSGSSSSVEVIDGGYEVEVTDLPGNTLENKIIRARGEVVHITARGDEFTIRNVGIQGPVAKGGNAAVIEPIVTSASGAGVISGCFIDDVGDNCVFVNASHSGRLDITNTYFGKSVEDSTYASPPGNGSEFTQRGKDAGEGGTVHIDKCYSEGAVDYAFRLGSPESSVTNSTVVDAGTALADLYGNSVFFENVDVVGSGIGLKIGDHDEGNMRLLAASGRTTVAAVVNDVRIDASDQVDRNDIAGVEAVLRGQIASNPEPSIPAGVPTSAEAAGRGQSSAGPALNRRRPSSSSAPIQPSGGTVTHPRDRTGPRIVVRSWDDLAQAADSAPAGARFYIPPGTIIRARGRSVTFEQDNISIYSDGTRFGQENVATVRQANGKTNGWQYAVIRFTGANATVAGLRLEGPTLSGFFEPGDPYPLASGVLFEGSGAAGGQVFNCEVVGWHHAGIWALDTQDLHVFLCNIHDNAMNHLGYGLKVQSSQNILAEYSLWDGNRHSITSDRDRDSSYTFQFNNVGSRRPNHAIDAHGESRSRRGYGGRRIVVRRNTIAAPEDGGDDSITLRG